MGRKSVQERTCWCRKWANPVVSVFVRVIGVGAIGFGIGALLHGVICSTSLLKGHETDILLITFGVLVLYTYYTRKLANAPYEPVASFWLTGDKHSYRVNFHIHSQCKRAMDCWCKLEICCENVVLFPPRFYAKSFAWYVRPLQVAHGHFDLEKTLQKGNIMIAEVSELESRTGSPRIHMKVLFGYGLPKKQTIWLDPIYYYYRVSNKSLVLDVGAAERTDCGIPE